MEINSGTVSIALYILKTGINWIDVALGEIWRGLGYKSWTGRFDLVCVGCYAPWKFTSIRGRENFLSSSRDKTETSSASAPLHLVIHSHYTQWIIADLMSCPCVVVVGLLSFLRSASLWCEMIALVTVLWTVEANPCVHTAVIPYLSPSIGIALVFPPFPSIYLCYSPLGPSDFTPSHVKFR